MADRKLSASTELAVEPAVGDLFPVVDISDPTDAATGTTKKMLWSTLKAIFAVAAKGVTNGDAHDHTGGDGAAILETGITLADNATLNASNAMHGLVTKCIVPAGAALLNVVGIVTGETVYTNKALFDATNPAAIGTATPGTATVAAHRDHVHANTFASVAEVDTGTEAAKSISPDVLAGSKKGIRLIYITAVADATNLTTGDGKKYFCIPAELNGMNLVAAHAHVCTVATGATLVTVQIRNVTGGHADILSTKITIDASEFTSYTAAAQPVINAANDDVATGDMMAIDIDAVGNTTTGVGLGVWLSYQLP